MSCSNQVKVRSVVGALSVETQLSILYDSTKDEAKKLSDVSSNIFCNAVNGKVRLLFTQDEWLSTIGSKGRTCMAMGAGDTTRVSLDGLTMLTHILIGKYRRHGDV